MWRMPLLKSGCRKIDNARDLLDNGRPYSALELLDKLKQRIWTDASSIARFRILTNIGAAKLALNKEREAAKLLIKAFQYNSDDEIAVSNMALAHFLLGHTDKAADYAKKTLEKNEANTSAYAILVGISEDGETLEEVISKVPESFRETPQIAQAISEIARQRRDFEQAIKWGETSVSRAQDEGANCQGALARILVEQILNDLPAMLTQQLHDSHKERLKRAVELFTEAWNSIENTEMRTVKTDWIIWKSTALDLLGEYTAAIEALNTAIQIEPDYPVLFMKRALLAFKQEDYCGSIGFLETIKSAPEIPEVSILLANILLLVERIDEAAATLSDFLVTNPPAALAEEAKRSLIKVYVARGDFDKAREISAVMCEASPTSVPFLIDAAKIAKATGNRDEALSLLEEAYGYARSSGVFQEVAELANELFNYKEFNKAATLYEKIADTSLNSQWTRILLESYYHSGERKKTLEICRTLREKYGPLEEISKMEFLIYDEIRDMNQARAVGEMYVNAFPNDIEMPIRLGVIHLRSNHFKELDRLLETPFDVKNLSLRASFDLAHLYQVRSKPAKALDIMYEARRTYSDDVQVYLKFLGTFMQVEKELGEFLNPTQVQIGTAVCVNSSDRPSWYIVEKREDADIRHQELNIDRPLAQRLLGKTEKDELILRQTPLGPVMGKISAIKSKYVYAYQETLCRFSEQFPEATDLWSIRLDDYHDEEESDQIEPFLKFVDQQDEASRHIEEFYKEYAPPIGVFANLRGSSILDTWGLLMSKPDLGIRCSVGNLEENEQALALLEDGQSKLIVDPISLLTIHCLGAADTVVKAFGRLGIAQSSIDELQCVINEREGMWSEREGMSIGKQGDRYVKFVITPEQVRRDIDYLKGVVKWTWENCDILPCTTALKMNQLRKRELDDKFQAVFIDSLLIASEPGNLLLSDDEVLRSYARTNLKLDTGTDYHVDAVWTQILLRYCLDRELLEETEYDKMTIQLICSNYYHPFFDADLLIKAAKQSNWNPSEPYSTLVRTLRHQRTELFAALRVAVDFLYKLWVEPIPVNQREYLTLELFVGLTLGRKTREVLSLLASGIRERFILNPLAERDILSLIQAYGLGRPI